MKFLLCCEFYHPSRGGVQEVMRQVAERLVEFGHEVTVATKALPDRDFDSLNGVRIVGFDVSGSIVRGMTGDVAGYQSFLTAFTGDAIMIKAAQQWTFDAACPVLDKITARKIFIPCGFSGLFLPEYADYFRRMPESLGFFDELIFYARSYRDIDFARQCGLTRLHVLPNGASEREFDVERDLGIRRSLGIGDRELILLSVGSPVTQKGHLEVAQAFQLSTCRAPMTLVLNGNWIDRPAPQAGSNSVAQLEGAKVERQEGFLGRALSTLRRNGPLSFLKRAGESISARATTAILRMLGRLPPRPVDVSKVIDALPLSYGKRIIRINLPRDQLVQTFLSTDLFVFASNIEYSPLVLFEAAAAGVPFVTVPVGNATEIAAMTGGGIVCEAARDEFGFTRADPKILAAAIDTLLADEPLRHALGRAGRDAWRSSFNWTVIARQYERILTGVAAPNG